MKALLKILPSVVLASLLFWPFSAEATLEVSASVQINATADFYAPLTPAGTWVEVGTYGRCWHPVHVAAEWRPYCAGSWVWTDCGWYWESDEPWAWACYHYGSWVYDPVYAWVWVPGIEWAPAWVSWRVGGGYVGWAPLPPRGFVARVEPPFVFVQMGRFHEPVRPTTVIVNNTTIINKTTRITNIREETRTIAGTGPRKVMVNEGPGLQAVQQATDRKVRVVSIHDAVQRTTVPPAVVHKSAQPRVTERPVVPQPTGREVDRERVTRPPEVPPKEKVVPPAPQPHPGEVRPVPPPHPAPQTPGAPRHQPEQRGEGKGEGKGHDKEH